MNRLICSLTSGFFILISFSSISLAKTPDGQTPAAEGICDVLVDGNYSKGLYGLCVAYCEAHDVDMLSPGGNPEELDVPNIKILENYRKKMGAGDPDMPCVQSTQCPCWTAEELAELPAPFDSSGSNFQHHCNNGELDFDPIRNSQLIEHPLSSNPQLFYQMIAFDFKGIPALPPFSRCTSNNQTNPSIGPPSTTVFISLEEFEACTSLLVARAKDSVILDEVWDCWED